MRVILNKDSQSIWNETHFCVDKAIEVLWASDCGRFRSFEMRWRCPWIISLQSFQFFRKWFSLSCSYGKRIWNALFIQIARGTVRLFDQIFCTEPKTAACQRKRKGIATAEFIHVRMKQFFMNEFRVLETEGVGVYRRDAVHLLGKSLSKLAVIRNGDGTHAGEVMWWSERRILCGSPNL